MKTEIILQVLDIDELKSFGSYRDVKQSVESEIGNRLGVNSWCSLYEKIKLLKQKVYSNKEFLLMASKGGDFKLSKIQISEMLGINIKARSWHELKNKIECIVSIFCKNDSNLYLYYESKKLKNFKDSSRLEGIKIELSSNNVSLESVLDKYRRQPHG